MTKKQFTVFMTISFTALVAAIILLIAFINQPAVLGKMTIVSGENTISPYNNTISVTKGSDVTSYEELILEDIIDHIPSVDVEQTFTARYTEDYLDDDMLFSMYTADLEPIFEKTKTFQMPNEEGSYVVRFVCSWGSRDSDKITQENYFIINYSQTEEKNS